MSVKGICPHCGSGLLDYYDGLFTPTGVFSPDGALEYRAYRKYDCNACGARNIRPKFVGNARDPWERFFSFRPAWNHETHGEPAGDIPMERTER